MKLTAQVLLVILLLAGAVVFVAEANLMIETGIVKRCARWDEFLSNRSANASSWQGGGRRATCTLTGLTASDRLGRRRSGLLSRPQRQGYCGSCWAFAAAHAYTDHRSIAAGRRTDQLAAQHPTACLRRRNGCCGARLSDGLQFFQDVGAVTDSCAPYRLAGYEPNRSYKRNNPIQKLFCPTSCRDRTPFQPNNLRLLSYRELQEDEVITALATGPVIAAMRFSRRFSSYRCGVFTFDNTDRIIRNGRFRGHAVEIVDYGTTSSGIDFWAVKNSWGSRWGEGGYFRIRRGDLFFAFATPVLLTSQNVSSPTIDITTCDAGAVSDPNEDTMVMCGVDVAIWQLNDSIPCRGNSPSMSISLASITSATAQFIEGIALDLNFVVNVHGCMQPTQADVNAIVILNLDNLFELTYHTYQYRFDYDQKKGGGRRMCKTACSRGL